MALTPPTDDQQAQKEYFDALNESLKVLENRKGPNWLNVMSGFLKPTRTGGFGESLGNATEALGVEQERDEQRAPQIAQMRAALAGQKYEAQKKSKAYELIANAMNLGSPEAAAQALQSGQGIFGLGQKFTPELYFAVSRYDPKIAETVKNAAGMDVERFKALNEATKTNMSIAQMYDQFGKNVVDKFLELQGVRPPAGGGQTGQRPPSTAPTAPSTAPTSRAPAGAPTAPVTSEDEPYLIRDDNGNVIDVKARPDPDADKPVVIQGQPVTRPQAGTAAPTSEPPATAGAPQFGYTELAPNKFRLNYSNRVVTIPEGTSPAAARELLKNAMETEQKIYEKAIEAEAKPWQEKQTEIIKYDDYATKQNLNRVDSILNLLRKNPEVAGILQNADQEGLKSWLQAIGAAFQEGVQVGNFGSVNVPIEKFISTGTMTRPQKAALAELSRNINQEFFAGMKANRGLLGVNPTDNDARLFQAAMAGTGNLAENIYTWAQGRAAEYVTLNNMYKGYTQFRQQGNRDPAMFFIDPNSPYHKAVQGYADIMGRVLENAPGMK